MELNTLIPITLVILGFVLIIAELFIGLDSMFDLVLSGSALLISGATGFLAENWIVSMALTFILLITYWVLGRRYVHKMIKTHPHKTNSDKLLDRQTKISRVNEEKTSFYAKIDGEEWKVVSEASLKMNTKVTVTKVNGAILEVMPTN